MPEAELGLIAALDAAYQPLAAARCETRRRYGDDPAVQAHGRAAWEAPALAFFRRLAGMPAFDGLTQGSDGVWFVDLRFVNPGRDWVPFRFGVFRDDEGAEWRAYQRDRALGRGRPAVRRLMSDGATMVRAWTCSGAVNARTLAFAYSFFKSITIDRSKISGTGCTTTLANYPMLQ